MLENCHVALRNVRLGLRKFRVAGCTFGKDGGKMFESVVVESCCWKGLWSTAVLKFLVSHLFIF